MLLSIIIVNYNVRYFLEQCLCSVRKAIDLSAALSRTAVPLAEVMVVDNNSSDGSISYLQPRFPFVKFIANKENIGFSRANNQALKEAKGKYVLFLNPDTILPEDVLQKTIAFLESHKDAGALGIRMIDGSGGFLKESKRGLPTAWASFCKMSGLTALFPSSKAFAGYYSGHLNNNTTQPVNVLAGAFMLAPREILMKENGFDEQFFMYAEDIDLSYRILKAGYTNYYFADAAILHFKGESTRKDARYVKLFYKAMRQFVRKHYQSGGGLVLSGLLNTAIRLRTGASMLRKRKPAEPEEAISQVSLKGDADTIQRIKPLLRRMDIVVRENSDVILFCEGNSFSFHHIIEAIQQLKPGQRALIHASGSKSIVGSNSKDEQGIGFEI